jgi:SOS-response transcriptional repressor LexA
MDPTISSGDLIAMKRIHDFRYLINGEIYGIVTSNGLRTIKRVRDNGQTLTLIPDNKEIPEQTIPKEIITNVFIIKGSIKQF